MTQSSARACGLQWSTSSFSDSVETSPGDLQALGQHLQHCQGSHRSLRALQRSAEAMHGFVAPRFVSTLAVLTALGMLTWVLI